MKRAWARARIHLDLGNFDAAVLAAREASAMMDWTERLGRPYKISRVAIFDSPELPVGWCWFEPERWRVLIARDTLYEFGWDDHLITYTDLATRLEESTWRSYDPVQWRALEAANEYGYAPYPGIAGDPLDS